MENFETTTREMLRNRPRWMTLDKIAKDLPMSRRWLTDFLANRYHGVQWNYLWALYNYLSEKGVPVDTHSQRFAEIERGSETV